MSIKIMSMVWSNGPEKQADRFVLLALSDYANDAGECWPAVKSIGEKVCMTERGVQKVIRRLEAEGWLEIDTGNGRNGCNQYTIKTPNTVHPEQGSGVNVGAETPNKDAKNPEHRSPEPSRTINEPSVVEDTPESLLYPHADAGAVDSFLAYRRKHKSKALSVTGARRLCKHLQEINERGGDGSDALGMAEERGWASVTPLWYFNSRGEFNGNGNRNANQGQRPDPALVNIARLAGLG